PSLPLLTLVPYTTLFRSSAFHTWTACAQSLAWTASISFWHSFGSNHAEAATQPVAPCVNPSRAMPSAPTNTSTLVPCLPSASKAARSSRTRRASPEVSLTAQKVPVSTRVARCSGERSTPVECGLL